MARLTKECPSVAVIALSSEDAPGDAAAALRCGAASCVCKDRTGEDLTPAIRAAAATRSGDRGPTGSAFGAVGAADTELRREGLH